MRSGSCGRSDIVRLALAVFLTVAISVFSSPCRADDINLQPTDGAPASPSQAAPTDLFKGLELGLGSSDLSGDFGAKKTTDIATVLASATYRVGDLRFIASVPWMRIDSPGAIFTGIEGSPIIAEPQASGGRRLRQGIGDLTLGVSYLVPSSVTHGVDTDLLFRVKVPTASDSSRLSTGEVDYSIGATVSKSFGRFAPLAAVFYRDFGDGPLFHLKNGFLTSVGTSYAFTPTVVGLLTYDYNQRASQYISDGHSVTFSLSAVLPRSPVRLTSFVSGGLSRGAPGVAAGLSLSLRL